MHVCYVSAVAIVIIPHLTPVTLIIDIQFNRADFCRY